MSGLWTAGTKRSATPDGPPRRYLDMCTDFRCDASDDDHCFEPDSPDDTFGRWTCFKGLRPRTEDELQEAGLNKPTALDGAYGPMRTPRAFTNRESSSPPHPGRALAINPQGGRPPGVLTFLAG